MVRGERERKKEKGKLDTEGEKTKGREDTSKKNVAAHDYASTHRRPCVP